MDGSAVVPADNRPLLQVDKLTKHFPIRKGFLVHREVGVVKAVDGVSFELGRGETLALVGESGSGKTTTGRLVLRLIEPTAGRVRFNGTDVLKLSPDALRKLRREMQIVFQDPFASLNPRMTVGAIVAEPLWLHGLAEGREAERKVAELLATVGLRREHAQRYPHEFSGGQRQRIGIARALAAGPQLIVADEPVSALDVSIRAQVINLMADLRVRFGLSYLFISHDLGVVRHMADRVAVMYLGRIVEIGPTAALFAGPRHPYSQVLLGAILPPRPGLRHAGRAADGDIPNPINPPSGCTFHTRCPHARERCRVDVPVLEPAGADHGVACHYWPDIEAAPAVPEAGARSERLRRLQQRFKQPQAAS